LNWHGCRLRLLLPAEFEHIQHELLNLFQIAFQDAPRLLRLVEIAIAERVVHHILPGTDRLQHVFNPVRHVQSRLAGLHHPLALLGRLLATAANRRR
jgi:hypothetical protein